MSKIIVQGAAQGKVLKTTSPINFLGAVDKKTGVIRDKKYTYLKNQLKIQYWYFLMELEVVLVRTQFTR